MCCLPAWVFPLLTALYLPVACLITYGMAVSKDHVNVNFPFISDMGIYSPESFVFAILLNFYSALLAFTVYLRYRQAQTTYSAPRERCIRYINVLALILGLVSCAGMIVVANIPFDEWFFGHVSGAFVTFTFAMLYSWVQTGLGYKMMEIPYSYAIIRHFRVVLCFAQAFLIIFFTVKVHRWFTGVAVGDYVSATSSEWALAFSLSFFFATYILEFRQLRYTPVVTVEFTSVQVESTDLQIIDDQKDLQSSAVIDVNEHQSQLLEFEKQH